MAPPRPLSGVAMLMELATFALGLLLLILGADSFIKGAGGIALRLGISPFVVGLTLVGFGTSVPELSINLAAAVNGRYGLAVGNVIGSNIANIGLILGLSAVVTPLLFRMRLLRIEVPLVLLVSAALWPLGMDGRLGRLDAGLLLLGFVALLWLIARDSRREPAVVRQELGEAAATQTQSGRNLLRIALGFALLMVSAQLMVGAAVELARLWGMSELLIGLTIVAVGTSLPELAASAVAAWRGQADIAVGNVLGSNLFNILLILGATAAVHPLEFDHTLLYEEVPAMILFALLLYPMTRRDQRIGRTGGALLVLIYAGFIAWQIGGALAG